MQIKNRLKEWWHKNDIWKFASGLYIGLLIYLIIDITTGGFCNI